MIKIANIITENVQCEATFTDIMQSLLRFAKAFEKDWGLYLVNARILGIVEDVMSSSFLATNSRVTNKRYITNDKMMTENKGMLPLLGKLGKEAPAGKTTGLKHPEYHSLYISSEEQILFITLAADALFKNDHKPALLRVLSFYIHAIALLENSMFLTYSTTERSSQPLHCFLIPGFSK